MVWDSTLGIWINPAFSLGAVINEASGGTSPNLSSGQALFNPSPTPTVFSPTVAAFSAYDPGELIADGKLGGIQIPIFNRFAPEAFNLPELPTGDDIKKWLLIAGAGVAGLLVLSRGSQ